MKEQCLLNSGIKYLTYSLHENGEVESYSVEEDGIHRFKIFTDKGCLITERLYSKITKILTESTFDAETSCLIKMSCYNENILISEEYYDKGKLNYIFTYYEDGTLACKKAVTDSGLQIMESFYKSGYKKTEYEENADKTKFHIIRRYRDISENDNLDELKQEDLIAAIYEWDKSRQYTDTIYSISSEGIEVNYEWNKDRTLTFRVSTMKNGKLLNRYEWYSDRSCTRIVETYTNGIITRKFDYESLETESYYKETIYDDQGRIVEVYDYINKFRLYYNYNIGLIKEYKQLSSHGKYFITRKLNFQNDTIMTYVIKGNITVLK